MHDALYYYSLWNGDYPYKQCTAVDGTISAGDPPSYLSPETPVSMNLWGLPKKAIEYLNNQWMDFYTQNKNDPVAEFLLPTALDEQIAKGLLEVEVIRTDEQWIGVTNPEDLEIARLLLKEDMGEKK